MRVDFKIADRRRYDPPARQNLSDEAKGYSLTGAFLLQALGKEPTVRQIELLDVVLVTIMEHGLVERRRVAINASRCA